MSEDVAVAQIVTAITTVFYAGVFAIGYYLLIKGNHETLRRYANSGSPAGGRRSLSRHATTGCRWWISS